MRRMQTTMTASIDEITVSGPAAGPYAITTGPDGSGSSGGPGGSR